MVGGVVNETVVLKNYALCAAGGGAEGVYVAFGPDTAVGIGQQTFTVSEAIAAYALSGEIIIHRSPFPACLFSLGLRDKV